MMARLSLLVCRMSRATRSMSAAVTFSTPFRTSSIGRILPMLMSEVAAYPAISSLVSSASVIVPFMYDFAFESSAAETLTRLILRNSLRIVETVFFELRVLHTRLYDEVSRVRIFVRPRMHGVGESALLAHFKKADSTCRHRGWSRARRGHIHLCGGRDTQGRRA